MKRATVDILRCAECGSELRAVGYVATKDEIVDGSLACDACSRWFRVERGLAELLPDRVRDVPRSRLFAERYGLTLDTPVMSAPTTAELEQREHFSSYLEDYERKVVESPYYVALDRVHFDAWTGRAVVPGALVLEIGAGTGRQTISLAARGARVLSLDLSEDMLLRARAKLEGRGLLSAVDLVVAIAERPPVRQNTFDAAVIHGTLHHLSDPAAVIQQMARCLRLGGKFCLVEPHASPLRPVFDVLMRAIPLYEEEEHSDARFTEAQLSDWATNAGLRPTTRLSTYLPPHLWYILGKRAGMALLAWTDALLSRLPVLRRMAGIVIVEGERNQTEVDSR